MVARLTALARDPHNRFFSFDSRLGARARLAHCEAFLVNLTAFNLPDRPFIGEQ